MELKARYDDIDIFCKKIGEDSESLNACLETMQNDIKELNTIWNGDDAKVFCEKFNNYLEKVKSISLAYNNIENSMKKANVLYKECDNNFAENIKKSVMYDE